MSLRTNAVIGAIFVALAAFVYFHEIRGGQTRREEAERAKKLLSFRESAPERLTLDRGDTVVVLQKEADEWRLTGPIADQADQEAVKRLLTNLQETERERVVVDSATAASDPGAAARYGLDNPRLRLLVELNEGPMDTVVFGASTPTDRYAYAQQRGANREVFVVRAWRYDNLNKGVFDLRDQRVLPFESEQVQEIRLDGPEQTVALQRGAESTWQLTAPQPSRADQNAVRSLLSRLQNGKVKGFAAEAAPQAVLAAYGLAPASTLELTLLVGTERAEKRLRIGSRAPTGTYYARDMSAPQVFEVDSLFVKDLDKTFEQLRDKKLLAIDRQQVTRLELARPGEAAVAVEKDTADAWTLVAPQAAPAREWKVTSLLTDLEGLEAGGYAAADDPRPLRAPVVLTVSLSTAAGRLAELRFARASADTVWAFRAGERTVYRVSQEDFGKVDLRLSDLAESADQPAAAPEAPSAESGSGASGL
jgi:hypothetical protein